MEQYVHNQWAARGGCLQGRKKGGKEGKHKVKYENKFCFEFGNNTKAGDQYQEAKC